MTRINPTLGALLTAALVFTGCTGTNVAAEPVTEQTTNPYDNTPDEADTPAAVQVPPETTPEPEPSPAPDPMIGEVGDMFEVTRAGATIGIVQITNFRVETTRQVEFGSPPANGYFLIFELDVSAVERQFDVYTADFYVRLDDGTRVPEGMHNAWDAVEFDELYVPVTLNPGERIDGILAFDAAGKSGQLVYAPNLDGAPVAEWEF